MAPDEGYQEALQLPSEDQYLLFYFKMDDHYGKGYCLTAYLFQNKSIKVNVRTAIQVNGSRNLRRN